MDRAYTRKEYIRKIPASKIVQYDMGNLSADFPVSISIAVKSGCHIKNNSLEAARIASNRYMLRTAGRLGFHLKIRTYPHHIVRENPMATGAGADRVQDGMRKAFGKPVNSVAVVKKNQRVISISTDKKNFNNAKEALRRASMKLPVPCKIVIDKGQDLIK